MAADKCLFCFDFQIIEEPEDDEEVAEEAEEQPARNMNRPVEPFIEVFPPSQVFSFLLI